MSNVNLLDVTNRSPILAGMKKDIPRKTGNSILEEEFKHTPGMVLVVEKTKNVLDGIYVWDGVKWSNAPGAQAEYMANIGKGWYDYLEVNGSLHEEDEVKRLYKIADALSNFTPARNLLQDASGMQDLKVEESIFNSRVDFYQVQNGMVNLTTGELIRPEPKHYSTLMNPVVLDQSAKCPQFLEKFAEICGGDQDMMNILHKYIGSSLSGEVPDYLLFGVGEGGNGKTVLSDIFFHMHGQYATQLPFSALTAKKVGHIPHDIKLLNFRRFAPASESRKDAIYDDQTFKQIIATTWLSVRDLYAQFINMRNSANIFALVNHLPIFRDVSRGLLRRILIVQFTQSFEGKPEKHLAERLVKQEMSGIFNWMLKGYQLWKDEGIHQTTEMLELLDTQAKMGNPTVAFINECIVEEDDVMTLANTFWEAFRVFQQDNPGGIVVTKRSFYMEFKKRFEANYHKHNGNRVYLNIRLKGPIQLEVFSPEEIAPEAF